MKQYSCVKAEENMPERPQGHIWIFFDVCESKGMYSHYIYRLIDF